MLSIAPAEIAGNSLAVRSSSCLFWLETRLRRSAIVEASAKRALLRLEHRDLDDMIALLADSSASDDALVTRLKKRKLRIKDEIVRIEANLGL